MNDRQHEGKTDNNMTGGGSRVLEDLRAYWNERSESYSRQNVTEMNCWRRQGTGSALLT